MSAEIIALPTLPILCSECRHVLFGSALYCKLFGEPLLDEREAEQCMGFERT